MTPVDLARSAARTASRFFNTAALSLAVLLLACPAAFAGQNSAIAISDNNVHIDRGTPYSSFPFLTASGGSAPYTFSVDPSTPPPIGITINPDGSVSGATCGSNGNFKMTVTATDAIGDFNTDPNESLIVNLAPSGACTLTFNQATLPGGLSLSSAGAITGTPSAGGPFNFTIQATDSGANTGTKAYTVTIGSNSLTVNPASLANGFTGTAYNQTVTASGGTGPYTFAV